jgi:ribokinase
MALTRKPIVVVGSINMDLVARTPRIPLAGETLIGTDFVTTPGGKGANQAVAAARLGYPVKMVGCVGEDVFGQALLDHLAEAGVGTDAVTRVAGPTGIAQILVADNGENSIVVVPGANGKVDSIAIHHQTALISSAGMVLCQLELPEATVGYLVGFCSGAGIPLMLDPAPAAPLCKELLSQTTWLTPNETEAAFYVGEALCAEESARRLFEKGVRGVVLKRGGEGAYVAVAGGDAAWVKPFQVDAVDTVGAGDCFNGAFAVALMEGMGPWKAARFASAAAAISVTRRGAQAAMPSRAEVDEFLAKRP